jgi:hypothetical protein
MNPIRNVFLVLPCAPPPAHLLPRCTSLAASSAAASAGSCRCRAASREPPAPRPDCTRRCRHILGRLQCAAQCCLCIGQYALDPKMKINDSRIRSTDENTAGMGLLRIAAIDDGFCNQQQNEKHSETKVTSISIADHFR